MQATGLLDPFPLWTILPLTVVLALLSVELGYRFARYRQQRELAENVSSLGGLVGGTNQGCPTAGVRSLPLS